MLLQEAQEREALAEFASRAGRAASMPSGSIARNASAEDAPHTTDAMSPNRGSDALASLLPNAPPAPPSPTGGRLLSPHSMMAVSRASTLSGARASVRTPSLLRRETAVTTARGAYFTQVGGSVILSVSASASTMALCLLQQLELAFAVHERMMVGARLRYAYCSLRSWPSVSPVQAEAVPADETVYRALLDICGRCARGQLLLA